MPLDCATQLRELRASDGLTEALAKNIDVGIQTMSGALANNNADVDVNPDAGWCAAAGGGAPAGGGGAKKKQRNAE